MSLVEVYRAARRRNRSETDYRAMQELIAEGTVEDLRRRGAELDGRRVLELAAGKGGYSGVFARHAGSFVASDIDRAEVFDHELHHVEWRRVDVTEPFPFADGEFGFIHCSSLVEHLEDRDMLFTEFARVLAADGFGLISFPPWWSLTLVGGHTFKPFHLLGEPIAIWAWNLRQRNNVVSYRSAYGPGDGLYPLTIDRLIREIESCGLHIVDTYTRMSSVNTTRLPGILADLFTWHACILVTRE